MPQAVVMLLFGHSALALLPAFGHSALVNRPGSGGGTEATGEWFDASTEEVSERVA